MTGGETLQQAEQLYEELQEADIEVLFDDRDESPGVKFNDADLIGVPLRLTVSQRAQQAGGVEFKLRNSQEKIIVPWEQVLVRIKADLAAMEAVIAAKVVEVPYEG